MKKVCMFLFIGVFLALMTALPCVADEGETSKVKFSINVGGLFAQISQEYDVAVDFDARYEPGAHWTEAVANIGMKFGIDIGASIFPMPQLEIYASYSTFGGTALGDYALTLPHLVYLEHTFLTSAPPENETEFKATVVNVGLAFHPAIAGKIKPYFGAGASSVTVKMDFLDSLTLDSLYREDWYWDGYAPYVWELVDVIDVLDITGVGFTEMSETVWGFHAKAGVNIELSKNIAIFVEGRYLTATVEFERPEIQITGDCKWVERGDTWYDYWYEITATWEEEWEIELEDVMEIKVGGIQGIVGIKFRF